jgi:hypothetical protein
MGSVEASFDLIKNDPSKILGLAHGTHKVTTPGQYIPKAGKLILNFYCVFTF